MVSFFQSQAFMLGWLILGSVSFVVLLGMLFFFGKLMWLQFRIWILASKGFHLIEHVGLDKVRSYFYLRPKENKFDFNHGFYMHYKDSTTKIKDGLLKPDEGGATFKRLDEMDEKNEQALLEKVKKFIYNPDSVTLKWGIPVITYVGNNPRPVNFMEPDKKYGAQVIRDMYIRLLATQRYKDMIMMVTIGLVAMALIAIALFLLFKGQSQSNQVAGQCLSMLNQSQSSLFSCIEMKARMLGQNSTVIL